MFAQVKRVQGDASRGGPHSAVLDAEMVIARGTGEDLSWLEDPQLPLMRHVSQCKEPCVGTVMLTNWVKTASKLLLGTVVD